MTATTSAPSSFSSRPTSNSIARCWKTFSLFARTLSRFAFEVRHPSWYTDETYEVLRQNKTALCLSETDKQTPPEVLTAGFTYARLRLENYTPKQIAAWRKRFDAWLGSGRGCVRLFQTRRRRQSARLRSQVARKSKLTTRPPLALGLFYNALPVQYIVEVVRPAIRSGGSKPMNEASAKRLANANRRKWIRLGWLAVLAACSVFVAGLRAQSPGLAGISEAHTGSPAEPAAPPSPSPNYALEERFLPDAVNKLVFDLAVTPHWFTLSDRFWYSYKTTEGTKYYIVDPAKKSKTLLWDNAKVAAALSTLTNFPYDAQNLPIKRLKARRKRYAHAL